MQDWNVYSGQDYVDVLRQILISRKARNSSYSLRAFARDLGMGPGRLSVILNGKGEISLRVAQVIAQRMDFDQIEESYFLALVRARTQRCPESRWDALKHARAIRLREAYQRLNAKSLENLNWRHFVARFLLTNQPNPSGLDEVSQRMGLSQQDLDQVIAELKQLQLIFEDSEGRFHCEDCIHFDFGERSPAIQNLHRSLLEQALYSLQHDRFEDRFFRSCIFTMNRQQYKKLESMIVEFMSACTDLEETEDQPHDRVFGLGLQFFPLA